MKKPWHTNEIRRLSPKNFIYIAFCLVALIVIYAVSNETGELDTAGQPYTSLDLRVAARATYQGTPLKIVSHYKPDHGISRAVINFAVPASGLSEYGLMTTPTTQEPLGGYPVLILLHGYIQPTAYSTKNAYLPDMEFYSRHGFVVIKPDLRGQGLSVHQGRPEGAYYSMAYNDDILSLIASVNKTPGLDSQNISLWGHSMGAYLALRTAVLTPEVKNVILLSAPVGNAAQMFSSAEPAKSDIANPVAFAVRKAVLKQYGSARTDPGFWYYASPLNSLPNTRAFIQIHVGAKDKVVPPKISANLDALLSRLGLPHAYYMYPRGDHGLLAQRQQIYARSLLLLEQ